MTKAPDVADTKVCAAPSEDVPTFNVTVVAVTDTIGIEVL